MKILSYILGIMAGFLGMYSGSWPGLFAVTLSQLSIIILGIKPKSKIQRHIQRDKAFIMPEVEDANK